MNLRYLMFLTTALSTLSTSPGFCMIENDDKNPFGSLTFKSREEFADFMLSSFPFAQSNKPSLLEKGEKVIELLSNISYKKQNSGSRLEDAKAKRHNAKIKNNEPRMDNYFLTTCKSNGITEEKIDLLSELVFAQTNRQKQYIKSLEDSLRKERQSSNCFLHGYASEFFEPHDQEARQRFIEDAFQIFQISEEYNDKSETEYLRNNLKTYYGFSRIYLSLIRDVLGTLYSREQALIVTGQKLKSDKNLTEEHAATRKKIISAHYLGLAERYIETISSLRPLAEVVSTLADTILDLSLLDGHISYATDTLQNLWFTEHEKHTLSPALPGLEGISVEKKPLSKNQKKRERLRRKRDAFIQVIKKEKEQEI